MKIICRKKATFLNCTNYAEGEHNVFSNKQDSAANVCNNNMAESLITDVTVSHQAALCHCL
jgi:hypothetical protein